MKIISIQTNKHNSEFSEYDNNLSLQYGAGCSTTCTTSCTCSCCSGAIESNEQE